MGPELKSLEHKNSPNEAGRVELKYRNLLQSILYLKCLKLGLVAPNDFEAMNKLFRKTSEIIDNTEDETSLLIRSETEAENYDVAADMVIRIVFPDAKEYNYKIF
jgi:hypothetical protein